MKITISGDLGSGKSTLGKQIAAQWGYRFYSTGDIFRKLSQEAGLDVIAGNKAGESNRSLDDAVDSYSSKIGREEDDFIFDSRLAWHFIPDSYSIYLYCRGDTAAARIYAAKRLDEQRDNVEAMLLANQERRNSELKRYQQLYGINLVDFSHYDLVLDTSEGKAEELADYLEYLIKHQVKGVFLSPQSLMPAPQEIAEKRKDMTGIFHDKGQFFIYQKKGETLEFPPQHDIAQQYGLNHIVVSE